MAKKYSPSPIEDILALYSITHLEEVEEFLENNSSLIPLLSSTYQNIKKYFSYSKVTLDVETDDEDATKSLAAHVVPNLPLEEALQQLKTFDDQWWVKAVEQAGLKFYVDLRFE